MRSMVNEMTENEPWRDPVFVEPDYETQIDLDGFRPVCGARAEALDAAWDLLAEYESTDEQTHSSAES